MIAPRIREMMGSGYIYDKDSDSFRKIQYKDIVILTRSIQDMVINFFSSAGRRRNPGIFSEQRGVFLNV